MTPVEVARAFGAEWGWDINSEPEQSLVEVVKALREEAAERAVGILSANLQDEFDAPRTEQEQRIFKKLRAAISAIREVS